MNEKNKHAYCFPVVWQPKSTNQEQKSRSADFGAWSGAEGLENAGATLAGVDFCIFQIAMALVSSELAHKSTVMDWLSGPLSGVRVNCQPSSLFWPSGIPSIQSSDPPRCLLQAASVSISNFCSIRFIWLTVRGRDHAQDRAKNKFWFFILFSFSDV